MLSATSLYRLRGVHPDLAKVVEKASGYVSFSIVVLEGVRTVERQRQLVAIGASRTMKSRHLTGYAVDLAAKVDGVIRWDWPLYWQIAAAMKEAAKKLGVAIVWGGDWKTFKDGPHFELDRKVYPT
jgi:peptidoglycan L-alanyl-D-glutamate endopeptidase CwlK